MQQAQQVCELPGNQGLIRKEISYGRKATTQSCADALLAVAQGKTPDPAFSFLFETLKPQAARIHALIDQIEQNPATFQQWVVARVNQFSPENSKVPITGYLVAGVASGGFSFGEPKFYLNLAYVTEFDEAKLVMAHELYHAVQGAYSHLPTDWWFQKSADHGPDHALAQQCSTNYELFGDLYQEGTAEYVGDPFLANGSKPSAAHNGPSEQEQLQDGIAHIWRSVTLLELSVTGLNAPDPVPYDEVYAMGFYTPATEYNLGYLMARALATDKGDASLAALLTQPGYAFIEQYMALPKYGLDHEHPKLEPNTVAAVKRLRAGCPRPIAKP
jgi:hypothetical protein